MKKSKKIIACLLAACALGSCLSFSGCLTATYISLSCRGMIESIEAKRKQRAEALDNVANETNAAYWIVDNSQVHKISANNERQSTAFYESAKKALDNNRNSSYGITAKDTHAYYLHVINMNSNISSNGVDDGKDYTKYDVALMKMDYETGSSTLLYTFDEVLCWSGTGTPDLYRIADDNHAVLYENGWVKVLHLTTKEITYQQQLYTEEKECYASVMGRFGRYSEWSDFVFDNEYYEYRDGGFVKRELSWTGLIDGNVGRYSNKTGYLERFGSVVYEDMMDRAFDLTTNTEIDFSAFKEVVLAKKRQQKGRDFFAFEQNGETYWYSPSYAGVYRENAETRLFEPVKELTDDFYREKSKAFADLCQIYEDGNDGPLKFQKTFMFNGTLFLSFTATETYLVGSSDSRPYLFTYDFINDTFQYVGWYCDSPLTVQKIAPDLQSSI